MQNMSNTIHKMCIFRPMRNYSELVSNFMMMHRIKRDCVFHGCGVRGISGNRVLLQGCPISLSWEWSSNQTERGGGKGKGEINPYQTHKTHKCAHRKKCIDTHANAEIHTDARFTTSLLVYEIIKHRPHSGAGDALKEAARKTTASDCKRWIFQAR